MVLYKILENKASWNEILKDARGFAGSKTSFLLDRRASFAKDSDKNIKTDTKKVLNQIFHYWNIIRSDYVMSMDLLPLTEFSKKNLEDCQKWRDENYERNTKKVNLPK